MITFATALELMGPGDYPYKGDLAAWFMDLHNRATQGKVRNMIGDAPRSELTGVPGWQTNNEEAFLLELATDVPVGGRILEIGGEFGMSAAAFAAGAGPDVEIISVDLFPGDLLKAYKSNLEEAGFKDRTKPVQADSKSYSLGNKKLDLLFIDGAHDFESVTSDIERFTPHVRVGGVVVFHDAVPPTNTNPHHLHYEVQRAIEAWLDLNVWQELAPVGTIRAFKRLA